tara:strand:- start:17744 stop:18550 length:807 start_codon:yes stop_codon:yes gene_type:complete
MNPKRQIIEQAIMDLEENREVVSQIYEERSNMIQNPGSDFYQRSEELDVAMEKAREERVNIAVRLFRDYLDYQGNPVVGNPNEAFYDPNPTPIFSVGDFHRGPGMPRTMPAITGARTKHSSTGRTTLRRIDKFIKQLKDKMKRRKDLQESNLFQLTEAKLKQMILDEMKSNLPIADQDQLYADIERAKEIAAEFNALYRERNEISDRAFEDGHDNFDEYYREISHRLQGLSNEFDTIAIRNNVLNNYHIFNLDGFIKTLKKKFRRKSL